MSDEPQRPTGDNRDEWKAYWTALSMPWRIEPEIDEERQQYLAGRRVIVPDIQSGVYPFRDIRLDRADVEWLLSTHESGRGPVDWEDSIQRKREGVDLRAADLNGARLNGLPLTRMQGGLTGSDYDSATPDELLMAGVQMKQANLTYARLEGAVLTHAHLEEADLGSAHLERADLYSMFLKGQGLANLTDCYFDADTRLGGGTFANDKGIAPRLQGVRYAGASLARIDWLRIRFLGDEWYALHWTGKENGTDDASATRLGAFEAAVRANRQLAAELRSQGVNEVSDRFAYRGHLCQRAVLRRQRKFLRYFGSLVLALLCGYGYRPLRSFYAYVFTIAVFAFLFWCVTNDVSLTSGVFTNAITWAGMSPPPPSTEHLQGYEAVVVSMTSFHGRGFFQPVQSPGDKVAIFAAIEAFFGLLLEIVLIATFTQRFFAR